MGLSFKIAIRFLKSSKGQTVLIALGIAIGVSVQIFIGLLIQGLQQSLVQQTIGNSSQITITSAVDGERIENWAKKQKDIQEISKGVTQISAVADASAFVKFDNKAEPVLVRGLRPEGAEGIYRLNTRIYEGKWNAPKDGTASNEVLIGKELKEKLGVNIGDSIEVVSANNAQQVLKVTGFFDLKVAALNKSWLITDMKTSQDIFGFGDEATSIEMQVNEVFKADEIASAIQDGLNDSQLSVVNWKAQNEQLLSGLNGQSISSIIIQVFVIISVVLGIASVLAITVMQKSRQIGILKAMGLKDGAASQVFLYQGLLLGIIGGILGIGLGVGLIAMFTKFAVNSDGTPVVNVIINWDFIAFSGGIAVLASTISSLIPARKSSKLSPIEVIRNA